MEKFLHNTGFMNLNKENYKSYIEEKLNFKVEISDIEEMEELIFVFYEPEYNHIVSEEKRFITNHGPLVINRTSGENEFMSAIDFSFNYGDRIISSEQKDKTIDSIISEVKKRRRIWWSDFEEIFAIHTTDLFESAVMYSSNPLENIEFDFKNESAKKLIIEVLENISATYKLEENHVIINLIIEPEK